ncbi:MAG TPA: 50S ribosomal protein L28 [Candidatus Eisenbacteria bacterium]|jgi:large subunit ribosomal protein L28
MAKVCEICGRGVQHGRNVSHANNVTLRRWEVNLRRVRAVVRGTPKRIRVCSRCLRSGRVEKRMPQSEARNARPAL